MASSYAAMIGSLRTRVGFVDRMILAASTQRAVRAARRRGIVADPVRFAALEFLGREGRGALHRLRGGDLRVAVRHRSRDVDILDELWCRGPAYEPPARVAPLLTDGMSVLDLGANVGLFGVFVLQRFPATRLISIEPDPFNLPVLERCIAANTGDWQLLRACASTHAHDVWFQAGRYADSRIVHEPSEDTVRVAAIDVLGLIDGADFVKIDIEGGEWPILDDPRFAHVSATVIVLEWHQDGCPHADACAAAVRAMRRAGYVTSAEGAGCSHGMVWAWREPDAVPMC